jgi:hypothetical protein
VQRSWWQRLKANSLLRELLNSYIPTDRGGRRPSRLVATALPDGYAQVSPGSSAMVYDDEHLALWERGRGGPIADIPLKAQALAAGIPG